MKRKAILVAVFVALVVVLGNQYTTSLETGDEWFNSTWHYRIKMEVNTSDYDRIFWPVEYEINFTQLFEQMNIMGTFDNQSVRVLEYNDTGGILWEMPSQFDEAENYNASSNAVGTLVFTLNGTNSENTMRQFYIYFDRTETGVKPEKTYNTGLNITIGSGDGNYTINNTEFTFRIDTERGENTSGLWKVTYNDQDSTNVFNPSGTSDKTREFTIISDGTYNYTFDLRGNATIIEGPARITVRQTGYEAYWNDPDNKTNMTKIVKEYFFYLNNTEKTGNTSAWIIIKQNITNIYSSTIYRESEAGFPGLDTLGAYSAGYKVAYNYSFDPGSWVRATYSLGGPMTTFINVNETGTSNFHAANSSGSDRVGIELDNTSIQPNESIVDIAAMVFGDTIKTPDIITYVRDRLINPLNITLYTPEGWWIEIEPEMYNIYDVNVTIFNRNESSLIEANITYDPFNFTVTVNATFNNGTVGSSDDVTIVLYDDGTHGDNQSGDIVYTNYFNFSNTSTAGQWNFTVKLYDAEGYFLNQTAFIFNVTDTYNLSMRIWEDYGLPRTTNATLNLTNYRRDTMILGANISCSYDSVPIPAQNITDLGDGTYNVTFYTGDEYGLYYLNCTATKDGNIGEESKGFTVESPQTDIGITKQPSVYELDNMTYFHNQSFNLRITMNNTGNSSAYDANLTISLPPELRSNETSYSVGTILVETEEARNFNITILNSTQAGEYIINITLNWTNLNASLGSNESFVNVTIYQNPELYVPEESRMGIIAPGNSSLIENFTVISYGNYYLDNITFNPVNPDNFTIEFIPENISGMNPGESQQVQMNVSVPSYQKTGVYNVTINITSSNNGYDILILQIIVSGTNMSLVVQPEYFISYNSTAVDSENFTLTVNTTNTGNTTAFYVSINFSLPSNWSTAEPSKWCGNVSRGEFCYDEFNVTIATLTPPGNYTVNVTVNWEDIDIGLRSNTSVIEVEIVSNVTLEVPEKNITDSVWHGTNKSIGNFNLKSTGNDLVENISFNVTGFENFTVEFNQSYPLNLSAGEFRTVSINVTVPLTYPNGTYNATLNITTDNAGFKIMNLSVTVPADGNWTMNTTYCEHYQSPAEDVLCDVMVNNTGNMLLDFNITPSEANRTNVSKTNFSINANNYTIFTVYYNVSYVQGQQDWEANYTIDAIQSYGNPDYMILTAFVSRFIKADIYIEIIPNMTEQEDTVYIGVNITSISGASIPEVILNVTIPNGTNYTTTMQKIYWFGCTGAGPGSVSCWEKYFPSNWGNATFRGVYNVTVFVNDSMGVNSTNTSVFTLYARYLVNITMKKNYVQGDWARVKYRAYDAANDPLPGAPVNISVLDSNNDSLYILTGKEYTTDSNGKITETSFVIPSDAPTGNYTVITNGSYYDSNVDLWIDNQTNHTFYVGEEERLTAKVTVPQSVYINYMMPVSVVVLEYYNQPVDPDTINLTIYRTEGYTLDPWRILNMSDLNKTGVGFYKYSEVLTDSVLTGSYLAVLQVTKGDKETFDIWPFRISRGGPYDVIITDIDAEIPQGGVLNFELYIENKGEVDHDDVNVTYWVSDGQTWYLNMFPTNIKGGENKTFSRTANIFSNQPPGMYFLNVMVKYDPTIDAASANATFMVTSVGPPPGPPGVPAGPPEVPAVPAKINITEYDDEVGIEIGVQRLLNIVVKNTGGATLKDVKLLISGPAYDWITVEPSVVDSLNPGSQAVFTLKIVVPRGEASGQYEVRMTAESDLASDEKTFTLFVFTSRKDLIEFELVRLKAKLKELENEADKLERQGIDVSKAREKLAEAEKKIEMAEEYLYRNLYDASLDAVYTAWKLLKEAEKLLEEAVVSIVVPLWVMFIVIFIIVIVVLAFLVRKMSKSLKLLLRGRLSEARMVAETVRGTGVEIGRLKDERNRTQRMLTLLESQYKQGIISKAAYESLKKRSESKLKDLDNKIRKSLAR